MGRTQLQAVASGNDAEMGGVRLYQSMDAMEVVVVKM